jgi:secondary thiamine-phosphate synthase enzyme
MGIPKARVVSMVDNRVPTHPTMQSHPRVTEKVTTSQRSEIVDVTDAVRRIVRRNRVTDGMAIVYIPHTTAGVTINENYDPDVKSDLLKKLDALIPKNETYYRHNEGNSESHLKTALVGNSATILIEQGDLVLGKWQGIYFCEFDGPREREMVVKLVDFKPAQE